MAQGELLRSLRGRLSRGTPAEVPGERMASVAITLKEGAQLKALMIRRAELEGDPWSGQIAFPGGRKEPEDESLIDTAIREAMEELRMDLRRSARYLGHLSAFRTHTGTMLVVPCVFLSERVERLRANEEVASHRWIPVESLLRKNSRSTYTLERGGARVSFPAYVYRDYIIWGLTHRIISVLIGEAGPTSPR